MKVELKEHAASCKGVEKLFEKEENSRLGKLPGVQSSRSEMDFEKEENARLGRLPGVQSSRSEMAAKERQRLVTECMFFKQRVREVNVFNIFSNEALTR